MMVNPGTTSQGQDDLHSGGPGAGEASALDWLVGSGRPGTIRRPWQTGQWIGVPALRLPMDRSLLQCEQENRMGTTEYLLSPSCSPAWFRLQVPQPHRPIVTSREQPLPIRTEGHAGEPPCVTA